MHYISKDIFNTLHIPFDAELNSEENCANEFESEQSLPGKWLRILVGAVQISVNFGCPILGVEPPILLTLYQLQAIL